MHNLTDLIVALRNDTALDIDDTFRHVIPHRWWAERYARSGHGVNVSRGTLTLVRPEDVNMPDEDRRDLETIARTVGYTTDVTPTTVYFRTLFPWEN